MDKFTENLRGHIQHLYDESLGTMDNERLVLLAMMADEISREIRVFRRAKWESGMLSLPAALKAVGPVPALPADTPESTRIAINASHHAIKKGAK